jgi:type IV secretion system protein VirB9
MTTAAHVLMAILAPIAVPPVTGAHSEFVRGAAHGEIVSLVPKRRSSARPGARGARAPTASVEAANRAALQEPRSDGFVDSVQVYPWAAGSIYRLYTAPGHITDIALQPGETLTAVAAGDTVRWIVGDTTSGSGTSRQVHILLKPSAPALSTNLVITTDRRIYRIQAEATQRTAMAAVSWTYPGEALLALTGRAADADDEFITGAADAPPFDFGYVLKGDKASWRPLRVFNDGRQVFIEFPPDFARNKAPPLFARGRDGATELLNYRVRGRFYVVDSLFETAELRLGGKRRQVVRIEHRKGQTR